MTPNDDALEQLLQSIVDLVASLMTDHGFVAPIGFVAEAANGSELVGHCRWADDHEGIELVLEKSDMQSKGVQSTINIRVQDGGSRRAVNMQTRWIPNANN
jgi:hypothetical protein